MKLENDKSVNHFAKQIEQLIQNDISTFHLTYGPIRYSFYTSIFL